MTQQLPKHLVLPYEGSKRTVDAMLKMADGPRGAQSYELRKTIEDIIRHVEPRDTLSRLAAIYHWFESKYSYVHDPIPTELVRDPLAILTDINSTGVFLGDCDDAATFLVGASRSIGVRAYPIRVGFLPAKTITLGSYGGKPVRKQIKPPFSHVLAIAKDQHGRTVALDPVAGDRTYRMLRRTTNFG